MDLWLEPRERSLILLLFLDMSHDSSFHRTPVPDINLSQDGAPKQERFRDFTYSCQTESSAGSGQREDVGETTGLLFKMNNKFVLQFIFQRQLT